MQLLQLFTQWLEMLCIGFSPNAFTHIPSPFAISTSGERNFQTSPATLPGGTTFSLGVTSGPLAEPSPEPGVARPGAVQGVAEAWYFTKAIAASSLQNSSSTITPSSNVMWSMLGQEEKWKQSDWHTQSRPRVLENVQRVYSHGPFRLQAQQALSDQQKFGSEIWDALDSNHEVSDDL